MIVDLHTHVWSSQEQLGRELAERMRSRLAALGGPIASNRSSGGSSPLDGSTASHERDMSCVNMALVFGFRSERLGAHVPNEFIADYVARDPRRRAGVAGVDPMSASAVDQLESAISMGFVGVTVSPASQGFHPMHSEATAIYERCEAAGLPVFFTMGEPVCSSAMLEFARPLLLDEVARSFPRLRVVVNQLGSPWIDETLLLLSKHRHFYADISGVVTRSWQLYNALLNALAFGVMDKLLFASGYPQETPAGAIESLYSINSISQGTNLPTVPRSQIRGIIERDALSCLGLDVEVGMNPERGQKPALRRKTPALTAGVAGTV